MATKVYTLRIALDGSDPEIWREVEVLNNITLIDLHNVIQVAMGWLDCHLHNFEIDGKRYSRLLGEDYDEPDELIDETNVRLSRVIKKLSQTFAYIYDMGDYWQHTLTLQGISLPDDRRFYPNLVDGKRACPPEDCGGVYGYYNMLAALQNKKHPEHKTYKEWIGAYDRDVFDRSEVNETFAQFDEYVSGWDRED